MAVLHMVAMAAFLLRFQNLICRRARHVVTEQAGDGLRVLQTGVRDETEFLAQTFSNGIGYVQQGPRQIQAALSRVQRRIEESRLQALLEVGIAGTCKGVWRDACCRVTNEVSDAPHGGVLPAGSAVGGDCGAVQGLLAHMHTADYPVSCLQRHTDDLRLQYVAVLRGVGVVQSLSLALCMLRGPVCCVLHCIGALRGQALLKVGMWGCKACC